MSKVLRTAWWVFACLCALVIAGSLALHIASKQAQARLSLEPGADVSLIVYRFLPDRPRVSLRFDAPHGGTSRSELGQWRAVEEGDSLRFANPGAKLRFRISDRTGASVYEALPAGSYGKRNVTRDLVQYQNDGDDARYGWPPVLAPESIPAGRSVVQVTVLEIDDALRGEDVIVVIDPPVGFKRGTGGMLDILWWFFFWPVYAIVLLIVGAILLWFTRRSAPSAERSAARSP